jgi:hypothetical protein
VAWHAAMASQQPIQYRENGCVSGGCKTMGHAAIVSKLKKVPIDKTATSLRPRLTHLFVNNRCYFPLVSHSED